MKATKTTTTKTVQAVETNSNIKRCAVKAYHSVITAAAHSYELTDGLVGKTPAMWAKATAEAQSDMDAIFAELGL